MKCEVQAARVKRDSADAVRVLILEDVPADAEMMARELHASDIQFTSKTVDTREAFINELTTCRVDIILADYMLPQFDGMTAIQLARERAPSIPIIVVTGSINEETAVECIKAGATDYVIKEHLARLGPAVEAALTNELEEGSAKGVTLALDGVKLVDAFDRKFVLVAVNAMAGRDVTPLAGATVVEVSSDRAAILATLQATDRWVRGRV